MRGENDNHLSWPFTGTLTVTNELAIYSTSWRMTTIISIESNLLQGAYIGSQTVVKKKCHQLVVVIHALSLTLLLAMMQQNIIANTSRMIVSIWGSKLIQKLTKTTNCKPWLICNWAVQGFGNLYQHLSNYCRLSIQLLLCIFINYYCYQCLLATLWIQ